MSFAKITLVGNIGGDPAVQYTPNGKQNVKFSLAVNKKRGDQESVNWFNVTAWGGLATGLEKLKDMGALAKGREVVVIGEFEAREYQDKQGSTRTSLDVVADTVQLVGGRGERQADGADQSVPF